METALIAACSAAARGEVPVGAVVLDGNGVPLAIAGNEVEQTHDASAHAELLAMKRAAQARGTTRLEDCTLVVTLEPCPMCAAAAVHFRVRLVVFGAYDPKGGGITHGPRVIDHPACMRRPEIIGGVRETEAAGLLRSFFRALRGAG
ncbi:nucleoside deaminase [Acetobacter conturbans]|uniref:tRNA-specific adenosine deaminase n=1 Tax=Acetobacter conturbans TaxID=1737472 RepID=A0ABX0K5L1_9PROT|nr:nucleoside deaminase [Acetobacter conturbans]NHN89643.1 nucleoside deaminase [Acetobacter conturbans]